MRAKRLLVMLFVGLVVLVGAAAPASAAPKLFIDLTLSAGRLSYFETTADGSGRRGSLWQRSVTERTGSTKVTLGAEKRVFSTAPLANSNPYLYSRAVISASAGRVLLPPLTSSQLSHLSYQMTDRAVLTETGKIVQWEGYGVRQSGPYAVIGRRVYRADGVLALDLDAVAYPRIDIFGSKVIYSNDAGLIRLRDLSAPASSSNPRTLAVSDNCAPRCNLEVAIWGDTVAWGRSDGLVAVRTLAPGTTLPTGSTRLVDPGSFIGLRLSEGVLSWHNSIYDDSISMLNLATSKSTPQALPLRAAEIDDHLIAGLDYRTGKIVVRALPFGLHTSYPPRLIGLLAPADFTANPFGTGQLWAPQIDVTKPVTGVQLTIARDGTAVRTLTGSGTDGSIRNLSWNGDDDNGAAAPAGAYTWTLAARATDGQGALLAADGHNPISGTVTLKR